MRLIKARVQGWGPAGLQTPSRFSRAPPRPCPKSAHCRDWDPCVFNQPQSNASSVFMGKLGALKQTQQAVSGIPVISSCLWEVCALG